MDISANNINNPVNFYPKNTGNNINTAIQAENRLYEKNVFAPELTQKESNVTRAIKRRRKSKRLNTIDSDYLPDEIDENNFQDTDGNFFITEKKNSAAEKFKKAWDYFITSVPLINYGFLKNKKQKIKQTVEILTDINQNVDELLNTAIPYGENNNLYSDIASSLTKAAAVMGKANKDFN